MPPKKKGAAKANGTTNKSTRSVSRAAPGTFTAHGQEYDATAAATRPVRKTAQAAPIVPDTAPAFIRQKIVPSTKRGPGRPPKNATAATPAKRGPGRPPKNAAKTAPAKAAPATKKRGRPAKDETVDAPPKKRGRPSKAASDAVPPEDEPPTPKKRGRPPKGGETTQNNADEEETAEQLEEELLGAADAEVDDSDRKQQAPASKSKGKGKKGVAKNIDADEGEAAESSASGKQYWLMKAEQDGYEETLKNGEIFNTKFTIDDLAAKDAPEPWDGVRNPTAAKNMREMKEGDLAFFYASGGKVPGIVGIMEIVSEYEPDKTTEDPNSYGFVENEKQRAKWCVVHVQFRKKFAKPITRKELLQAKEDGPLSKMQEFNAARLSVSKVNEDEWRHIMGLVEDEEEEDTMPGAALDDADAPSTNVETVLQKEATTLISEQLNGDVVREPTVDENEIDLPAGGYGIAGAPPAVMTTTEDDMPTTDALFPPESSAPLLASSRPTSLGTGVKATGNSRPGSRASSLAPAAKGGRARSRSKTPLARGSSAQPETSKHEASAAVLRDIIEE